MGIVKGLKAINAHIEAEDAKFSGGGSDAPKTVWFKIKDKQAVKVTFLQELDANSPKYSLKNDLGFVATEHVHPDNYRIKAVCTADEGACPLRVILQPLRVKWLLEIPSSRKTLGVR